MKRILIALFLVLSGMAATAQPVIGISAGWSDGRTVVSDNYANAVFKAGGIPCTMPLVRDSTSAALTVSHLDALILTGGEDVDPSRYGQEILNGSVEVNAVRDTSDFLLAAAAVQRGIPILATCRGEQLINVLFGGTLYQDIPVQVEKNVGHSPSNCDHSLHKIKLKRGSLLRKLIGKRRIEVNSFHHQAVCELGEGLKESAVAPDGIVEAFEGENILAVQFHPEMLIASGNMDFLPVYLWLVNQAR